MIQNHLIYVCVCLLIIQITHRIYKLRENEGPAPAASCCAPSTYGLGVQYLLS